MNKLKVSSVSCNGTSSREPMKRGHGTKPGHRMAECLDGKFEPRSKGSTLHHSNDRSYVKSKSSIKNIYANVNNDEDEAS